jgi:hypothetical protein
MGGPYRSENRKKLLQPCCFYSRTIPVIEQLERVRCNSIVTSGTWG